MPGIAAYVYTKSGNLSSYGRCNAWGGGRGGQGSHCQPPFSNYTGSFGRRRSLSIGWEEHGALQAANGVLGSKCSEILIRQSNGPVGGSIPIRGSLKLLSLFHSPSVVVSTSSNDRNLRAPSRLWREASESRCFIKPTRLIETLNVLIRAHSGVDSSEPRAVWTLQTRAAPLDLSE